MAARRAGLVLSWQGVVSSDEGTFAYMRMLMVDPGTQSEVVNYTPGICS